MLVVTIIKKGEAYKRLEFDKPEVTIGRVQGNDIILPEGNISKRHSRIVIKDGRLIVVDLKSTMGTYVNGRKLTSPLAVQGTDKICIGDFMLQVDTLASAGTAGIVFPTTSPAPSPATPPLPTPANASSPQFTIVVEEKGGDSHRHEFDKPEVIVGRVTGNDIILPRGNVSKRHSQIVLRDSKFTSNRSRPGYQAATADS